MCDCCPCDPCCCPPQTPQKQSTFERLTVVVSPRSDFVITSSGEIVTLPSGLQPRFGGTVLIERAAPVTSSSVGKIVGAMGVTPSRPQSKYLPPDEIFPVSNPSNSGAWPFCQDLDLYKRSAISRSGKRWNNVFALDHSLRKAYSPPQISSGFLAQNDPLTTDIIKVSGQPWSISSRAADDFALGDYEIVATSRLGALTLQAIATLEMGVINLETDAFAQPSSSSTSVVERWYSCLFKRAGIALILRVTAIFAVFRTFVNAQGQFETVQCFHPSEPGTKAVGLQRIYVEYNDGTGWAELIRYGRGPGGAVFPTTAMGQQTRTDLLEMVNSPTVNELLVGDTFVQQTRSSITFDHFYTHQSETAAVFPVQPQYFGRYISLAQAQTDVLERLPFTEWAYDAQRADVARYAVTGNLSSWAVVRRPPLPILGGMSSPEPLFVGALTLSAATLEVRDALGVKQVLVSDLVPMTSARDVASPAAHYHHPLASALLITKPEQGGGAYNFAPERHLAAWHPWRDAKPDEWKQLGTRRPPTYPAFVKHAQAGKPVPVAPEHGLAVLGAGLALYSEAPFKPTRPPFFLPEALERFEGASWNSLALAGALEQYPEGYHADPRPELPLTGTVYPGKWFWPDDRKRVKLTPGLYRAVYRLDDWHAASSQRHPYLAALVGRAIRPSSSELPVSATGGLVEWHGLAIGRAFSVFSLKYQNAVFDFNIGDVIRLEFQVIKPTTLSQLALMPV